MTTASQTPGEPAELDALVALAQREHRAGRLAEAAAAYRKILALRPDIAEVHNNLGNVLLARASSTKRRPNTSERLALKPEPLPGAQQPGQHPPAAGQARPGRGTVSASASLCGPIWPRPHNNLGNVLWTRASSTKRRLALANAAAIGSPSARQLWAVCQSQQPGRSSVLRASSGSGSTCRGHNLARLDRQARPGLALQRSLSGPTLPKRTTTWATSVEEQGKFDEAAGKLRAKRWLSGRTTPKRITIAPI